MKYVSYCIKVRGHATGKIYMVYAKKSKISKTYLLQTLLAAIIGYLLNVQEDIFCINTILKYILLQENNQSSPHSFLQLLTTSTTVHRLLHVQMCFVLYYRSLKFTTDLFCYVSSSCIYRLSTAAPSDMRSIIQSRAFEVYYNYKISIKQLIFLHVNCCKSKSNLSKLLFR